MDLLMINCDQFHKNTSIYSGDKKVEKTDKQTQRHGQTTRLPNASDA